jgi:ring-1,2-phenylacetyl-CoA epoxidase subunit PaaC
MNKALLADYLLALGDDELLLGHRVSEWCGHAPILEEDIAFANIALDEIGHARLWYQLVAELRGEDPERYPDQLAFFRPAAEFRALPLLQLPNGDWAFSLLRQYLFDAFEAQRLEGLVRSEHAPLAEIAAKIRTEEIYHLRHTRAWIPRLGLGTEESYRRLQAALDELWPYAQGLGLALDDEAELVEAGLVPATSDLFTAWLAEVSEFLENANLTVPAADPDHGDRTQPTEHLEPLLADMQQVARFDAEATW